MRGCSSIYNICEDLNSVAFSSFISAAPICTLKGLGNEKEFNSFEKMVSTVGLDKNLYWFLNLEDKPLMRCRHCNFPRGKGETILENWYLCERYIQKSFAAPVVSYWFTG